MRIGEVARRSGVSARMLRHYDSVGLVSPRERTSSGYREYSEDDVRRILHVEGLRALGLGLAEVRSALEDPAFAPQAIVSDLIHRTRERIAAERELLDRLEGIGETAPGDWQDVLTTVGLVRALRSDRPMERQHTALAHGAAQGARDGGTLPTEQVVEALLDEEEPNVAGALRWAFRNAAGGDSGLHAGDAPPAALRALERGLRSAMTEQRRRAVEALAVTPGEQATSLLLEAAEDPEPAVRARATLAAGERGSSAAVGSLIRMVAAGEWDVEAAEVLGRLARDEARRCTDAARVTDAVLAALGRGDPGAEGHEGDGRDTGASSAVDAREAATGADLLPGSGARAAAVPQDSQPSGPDPDAPAALGLSARRRLVQALGELPREAVASTLTALAETGEPGVARIARYLLTRE